jgi:hypothetical protein
MRGDTLGARQGLEHVVQSASKTSALLTDPECQRH